MMVSTWWQESEAEGLFPGSGPPHPQSEPRSLEQRLLGWRRAGPGGAGQSRQRPRAGPGPGQPGQQTGHRSSHYTHTKLETTTRANTDSQTGHQGQNWNWKPYLGLVWTFELPRYLCKKHLQCDTVFHSENYRTSVRFQPISIGRKLPLSTVTQWRWKHENNRKSWELSGDPLGPQDVPHICRHLRV